jgi:hypothetical protein
LSGFIFATTSAIVAAPSDECANIDMHTAKNVTRQKNLRIRGMLTFFDDREIARVV